jgi:hypothetical protein
MHDRPLRTACAVPAASAAVAAGLALLAAPAQASVPLEARVISGAQAPGAPPGTILDGFGDAVVNDAGEVAFLGFVHDPLLAIGGAALFGPDAAGDLTVIATDSEQVPDLPPGTELRLSSSTYFPRLDDTGHVAFFAGLSGPEIDSSNDAGVWRWQAETGLERLVREGDPVPEAGAGVTLGGLHGGLFTPAIGAASEVAVTGWLIDPSEIYLDTAYFAFDAAGDRTLVAREGMPVPGVPGAAVTYLDPPFLDDAGGWSFVALFEGPDVVEGLDDGAVFAWDSEAGLAMRLRDGDPAPGTPPGVVFASIGTPYPNDAGNFAYLTFLAGPGVDAGNNHALYGPDAAGALVLLAREGDPAPGTELGTVFKPGTVGGVVVINASGRVAFWAELAGPAVTAETASAIWLWDPAAGAIDLVARAGDPAPELPGVVLAGVGAPILSDRGDLVFEAGLAGPDVTPYSERALFAIEAGGLARKVVRLGDLVAFGPCGLQPLAWYSTSGIFPPQPGASQLSDNGHLVFNAAAQDGTQAIFVATLPEPGTGAGVVAGVLLLAWLRRRPRGLR